MDKERLVRRTQTRRSQFRVLGKPEITAPVLEPATTEKEVKRMCERAREVESKREMKDYYPVSVYLKLKLALKAPSSALVRLLIS